MTTQTDAKRSILPACDRPGRQVPSVDQPWEAISERQSRAAITKRDLAQHRAYHSLFEDLMN
ncbi:hypothetical protein [uncultured Roseobacter sp.]|uniref:hypothetical protein n=1 Tax=uncultured Roseobacter sp. TaxID=114847 RepID=UPI0026142ECE|nr:hypothetical protein [uncultured Roseobacter sp.]